MCPFFFLRSKKTPLLIVQDGDLQSCTGWMLTSEKLGLSTSTLQFQWWKRRTRPPFWVLWVWGRMCNNSSSKMRDLSLLLTPLLTDHTPCDYLSSGVLQHSDSPITPANARALFFDLASHQVQREARAQEEQKTNYLRIFFFCCFELLHRKNDKKMT